MQSTYKYRFDHSTIYWTLIYIIVFVLLGGLLYHLYEGGYLSAWFTSFIVALVALMSLSIPRKIVVSDDADRLVAELTPPGGNRPDEDAEEEA